jgi:hypothetical protein
MHGTNSSPVAEFSLHQKPLMPSASSIRVPEIQLAILFQQFFTSKTGKQNHHCEVSCDLQDSGSV